MKTSEFIADISAALLEAQSEMPAFPKSAKGHGYNYTPMDDIVNGLRPLLNRHGLVLMQTVSPGTAEMIALTTTLIHPKSGEWIQDTATIPAPEIGRANAAQATGAAITYLRRYAVTAMFFLSADEDNDAASPQQQPQQFGSPKAGKKKAAATTLNERAKMPPQEVREYLWARADQLGDGPGTEEQQKRTVSSLTALFGEDWRVPALQWLFDVDSTKEMTSGQHAAVREWVAWRKGEDDVWYKSAVATDEASAIIRQMQIDNGQGELPL